MIDIEALREAVQDECMAAYLGGGLEPALMDALSVDDMDAPALIRAARSLGIDVEDFEI